MPRRKDAKYISINTVSEILGFDYDTCRFLLEERHIASICLNEREYRTTRLAVTKFEEYLLSPNFPGIRRNDRWLFKSNIKQVFSISPGNSSLHFINEKIKEHKTNLKQA